MILSDCWISLKCILSNSRWFLMLLCVIDESLRCLKFILDDSQWFFVIFDDSLFYWWFLNKSQIYSWLFSVILGYSWWFFMIPNGVSDSGLSEIDSSQVSWFLVILCYFQIILKLILHDYQQFLMIFNDSQWFLVILK